MDVRPFEHADLKECAALFVSVFNSPPWNERWELEAVTQRLEDGRRAPGFYGLVVTADDEAVGFATGFIERWDEGKHFYLKDMCVASERQRDGIGTALINALEGALKGQGVEKLYLYTARDTPAQDFYEKQEFYVSAKMIMMAKRLTSA